MAEMTGKELYEARRENERKYEASVRHLNNIEDQIEEKAALLNIYGLFERITVAMETLARLASEKRSG